MLITILVVQLLTSFNKLSSPLLFWPLSLTLHSEIKEESLANYLSLQLIPSLFNQVDQSILRRMDVYVEKRLFTLVNNSYQQINTPLFSTHSFATMVNIPRIKFSKKFLHFHFVQRIDC